MRHYSLESEDDIEETRSNIRVSNIFGRRRFSSGSNKSNRFKILSKHLSAEETEINKERLAAVGDLMSVFYEDEDDASSDQDDLIEELQDIGYIITPKGISTKSVLSNCDCKTRTAGKTGQTSEQIHKTSFQTPLSYNRMVHERKQ